MNADAVAEVVATKIAESLERMLPELIQRIVASSERTDLLTTNELARALKVSRATVKRYAGKGMPVERAGERSPRFRLDACLAWHREFRKRPQTTVATRPATGIRRLSR